MLNQTLSIQCLTDNQDIAALEPQWNRLHQKALVQSIYNSFDFVYQSIRLLPEPDCTIFVFVVSERNTREMVAVFPLQLTKRIWHHLKINTFEYAAQYEIDKPYPVIKTGYEKASWRTLLCYLNDLPTCDHLQLFEMPLRDSGIGILKALAADFNWIYRENPDKQGPVKNLSGDWADCWSRHKKMRKKVRKMEKDFNGRIRFTVYDTHCQTGLEKYLALERKSNKKLKNIGISKDDKTTSFYRELFKRLEHKKQLRIGLLLIDDMPVSAEIAYICGLQVYFCHGCYDMAYQKYSPGMVSTSFFIRYFYNSGYMQGDFLCGYASYLNDWADEVIATCRLDLYKNNKKMRWVFFLRAVNKIYVGVKEKFRLALGGIG